MALDRQPCLTGELVVLRPLRADDFDALFAVASDPRIWEQHPVPTRYREDEFRTFFADALASGGALLIRDRATSQVIGSSRFQPSSIRPPEVEIGWTFLARSHWGGAANGEVKRLMCRHAFGAVDSVVLLITPSNLRSRRAAEKVGGVLDDEPDAQGRLVYRITPDTWT